MNSKGNSQIVVVRVCTKAGERMERGVGREGTVMHMQYLVLYVNNVYRVNRVIVGCTSFDLIGLLWL